MKVAAGRVTEAAIEHESSRREKLIHKEWGLLPYLPSADDTRLVLSGDIIPAQYYADQPYVIKTADGAWLCVVTTGSGHEGSRGQHIVSLRSDDCGKTWSPAIPIESPEGPEASWAVPMLAPSDRVFVFYVYNGEDIRELPCDPPGGTTTRMDSHGQYVFRWSDDHGRTWSDERVEIPVREFAIDRENSTQGKVRLFWNVGRPLISRGSAFLTLHKVAGFGAGWFTRSEGAFVRSDNLLSADDPRTASWITLPEGDHGLRTPPGYGPIAEEQSLLELSDGSLYCIYRSIDGHPVGCASRDRGATWEEPRFLHYVDGRKLKHPRAACFAWRLACGAYVLWFHNHGGDALRSHPARRERGYDDRNPVWMCRGSEVRTPHGLDLVWETPEIVLYDDDPCIRMSYPDLREEADAIYLTETQKAVARVHRLSDSLVQALRKGAAGFRVDVIRHQAALDWDSSAPMPVLPQIPTFLARSIESPYGTTRQRSGFTVEMLFSKPPSCNHTLLAEAWTESFGGLRLEWLAEGCLRLTISDGRTESSWHCDVVGAANTSSPLHVTAIVDGGPGILSFMVQGIMSDGGESRQFGWGRISPHFRGLPGGVPIHLTRESRECLHSLRIYPRALLHTEARALFLDALGGPGASSGDSWVFTVKPDLSEISSRSSVLGATP